MGRPPKKARYLLERQALAVMIDKALKDGQRSDGTPEKHWTPWRELGFADRYRIPASSLSAYRNVADPTRPNDIVPLLNAFYGTIPAYRAKREAMRRAWRLADGIDPDDPPDPRTIRQRRFSDVAEVASLVANQPIPDNQGRLIVPFTLGIRLDRLRDIEVKLDGHWHRVTMDIGLTRPIFLVESQHWHPTQESLFRRAPMHPNTVMGPVDDSVTITGPTIDSERPAIEGRPLADERHILMESKVEGDDGPITLAVKAARDGFYVCLADGDHPTATQSDVLDAIFAEAIPRDARNRLEVVRVDVTPRLPKPSE